MSGPTVSTCACVKFWKAPAGVFHDARHQRCRLHETANVPDALPKSAQPGASTSASVRLRTKVAWGAGSATAASAVVLKLVESAQGRWRAVNAPRLVALVRAGARCERGRLVERLEAHAA